MYMYIIKLCCSLTHFISGDVNTVVSLGPALKFNGGGHINHSIFWQNMSSDGGEPSGKPALVQYEQHK